jgi:hypothetical protein
MFVSQQDESVIVPLNAELKCDTKLELANSSLSEFAVMGVSPHLFWEGSGRELTCYVDSSSMVSVGNVRPSYPSGKHRSGRVPSVFLPLTPFPSRSSETSSMAHR